jgi:hypothetical protein
LRAIPTSRAYWELRAEQVLNRVFAPEAPIDIEPTAAAEPAATTSPTAGNATSNTARVAPLPRRTASETTSMRRRWWSGLQQQPTLLMAGLGLAMTLMTGTTLVGLALWQQGQQAIRQERNLLLVERLRSLGPAQAANDGGAATVAPDTNNAAANASGSNGEPPPPPSEPWMEELATLPASSAPPANVLRVPMNGQVASPAPAASGGSTSAATGAGPTSSGDMPQLVGVVQVPGRPGSAIFQVGGSSTSAATGETIGSSGWRLRSASGDSAVIESNGVQRRLSISSGL